MLLDAALQGLAAAMSSESLTDSSEATYLPVSFEKIRVFGDVGRRARCRAELVNPDGDGAGIMGRVLITDDTGTPTAEISGIYLQRVQRRTVPLPLAQKIFDTEWVETPVDAAASAPDGSWLVLTDGAETEAVAKEFVAGFGSPTRRVISADLSQESAVLEAFSQAAGDAELPPVGVVIFAGRQSFDGTESGDAAGARPRPDVGGRVDGSHDPDRVARQVAATVAGVPRRSGRQRRRTGRPVDQRADRVDPGSGLRAPGPAHHVGRPAR